MNIGEIGLHLSGTGRDWGGDIGRLGRELSVTGGGRGRRGRVGSDMKFNTPSLKTIFGSLGLSNSKQP